MYYFILIYYYYYYYYYIDTMCELHTISFVNLM